jgi:hypothetical protein
MALEQPPVTKHGDLIQLLFLVRKKRRLEVAESYFEVKLRSELSPLTLK